MATQLVGGVLRKLRNHIDVSEEGTVIGHADHTPLGNVPRVAGNAKGRNNELNEFGRSTGHITMVGDTEP
eukprot:2301385-Lingulodinium_polyedra.AAC.1